MLVLYHSYQGQLYATLLLIFAKKVLYGLRIQITIV